MGQPGQKVPEMTDEFIRSVTDRYIELYEHITGQPFVKGDESNLIDRIAVNVEDCLTQINL